MINCVCMVTKRYGKRRIGRTGSEQKNAVQFVLENEQKALSVNLGAGNCT